MSTKNTPSTLVVSKVRRARKYIVMSYRKGDEDHGNVRFPENPLPAFDGALTALGPLVCKLLALPESYTENLKVTGLTIADAGGTNEQVTIVAQKSLPDANGPFNIATPLRLLDTPADEGSYSPPLSEADANLVQEVIEQAKAYVLGERAQGTIAEVIEAEKDAEAERRAAGVETSDEELPLAAPDAPHNKRRRAKGIKGDRKEADVVDIKTAVAVGK